MDENRFIEVAKHAIGLVYRKPYKRHGKRFYRPYRNYFAVSIGSSDYELWETMKSAGYAECRRSNDRAMFWLTRVGLDWLGEKLGMRIYDEED